MYAETKRLELGDIFDRVFRLFGKTFTRTAMVGLAFLGPATLIYAITMKSFFTGFAQFTESIEPGARPDFSTLAPMLAGMMTFMFGSLVEYLAFFATTIAVIIIAGSQIEGEQIGWQETLRDRFMEKFMRALGQALLQFFAIIAIFLIPFVLILLGSVSGWFAFFGVIGMLAAIPIGIHLFIKWAFTIPAIALEDAGVFESFDRSASLVEDDWWRVFGILLVLTFVLRFAISIITTPINLIGMWGFFSKYFQFILSMKGGHADPTALKEMFRSMGLGVGIASGVTWFLLALASPIITTVIYFDLRFRKAEFTQPLPPESSPSPV